MKIIINVYKIKLLAGRNLRSNDTAQQMIINTTYAKVLGFRDPARAVGKFIDWNKKKSEIIGVAADFYERSLHEPIKPLAIIYLTKNIIMALFILPYTQQTATGNEWKKGIASIQTIWKQLYPDDDFDYHFYDEDIAKFYDTEQHTSNTANLGNRPIHIYKLFGLTWPGHLHYQPAHKKKLAYVKCLRDSSTDSEAIINRTGTAYFTGFCGSDTHSLVRHEQMDGHTLPTAPTLAGGYLQPAAR